MGSNRGVEWVRLSRDDDHHLPPPYLPQKSILNLSVDFVQPLLGAVGFVLIICNLSLEFRDPIFGRPKLMGKLLGQFEGTLTV